jgi:hypothetical protein
MAAKSTSMSATPKARTRRKPKPSTVYSLSRHEMEYRNHVLWTKELTTYINSLTEDEMKVVGHVCPYGDPANGIKEMKRLLGESIAKCKVIPFPIERRLAAKEDQK